MGEQPTRGDASEPWVLILMSLMSKLADIERKQAGNGHSNGNGKKLPWQQWTLGLLSVLFGLVSFLFWDIRAELTDVRRTQDTQRVIIAQSEELLRTKEQRALELRDVKNNLAILKHQGDTMAARLWVLRNRLDRTDKSGEAASQDEHDGT